MDRLRPLPLRAPDEPKAETVYAEMDPHKQAIAARLRDRMNERGGSSPVGQPGTLGDGNSDDSLRTPEAGPVRTEGLD